MDKLILIQVGEKKEFAHIREWLAGYGIEVECYWYPKEISDEELEIEIADLRPFASFLAQQGIRRDRECKIGLKK